MTADREQVRRDALREQLVQAVSRNPISPDDAWAIVREWDRLASVDASVPALVEALRRVSFGTPITEGDLFVIREVLARYEQSQGCDGSSKCRAAVHLHGCFAEQAQGKP